MKTRALAIAVILAATLAAWPPAIAQQAEENPLNQLAWMVGGTWNADAPQGPDGKPFHAEWKGRWGANHRTIEFTVWFRTEGKLVPIYSGLYAWHPGKKKAIFVYTDNEGNLTEGEAAVEGDRVENEFQIIGSDGVARPFRSTEVRRGPDAYDWNVQHMQDGAWTEMFALKYTRSKD